MLGAGRTEWGQLTNPQVALQSYRPEPVAVRERVQGYCSNPALLAPQCRYEAIWVWSSTTFIVNEAVVNRKLAVN